MTAQEKREKIAELKKKIDTTQADYDRAKAMQLALKLVINGTYGAFAHPKFVLSNSHIANAITAMGRDVIQYMLKMIENYFYNEWHLDINAHEKLGLEYIGEKNGKYFLLDKNGENIHYPHNSLDELLSKLNIYRNDLIEDKKELNGYNILCYRNIHDFSNISKIPKEEPIIIYGDTDSCHKDTIIITNNGEKTIEYFYNENIKKGSAGITLKGHESVYTNDKILNYDENKGLYYAPVKRIIRHKVSKTKWKLKTKSGEEIIVTNDHSMIVFRNGKKLEVKPSEILKTDKILSVRKK
jgi:DNA polymerase elongation subunit (family B)